MSSDNASGTMIGAILHGSYHITRKIAAGGMGAIYEAHHVRLKHKRFAIKLLHPSVAQVEDMYARFRREAEIATQLGHPNIINVLDFNETEDGQPYMVMEYLEGHDLGVQIRRARWLSRKRIVQIVNETASALQAAHNASVVHRDIKPANIFLARQRERGPFVVKVLDFGISKIQRSQSIITKANQVMGSASYMSPEQAIGMVEQIDHRTDIFALGAICYQMLCGRVPFPSTDTAEKLRQIIRYDPPAPSSVRPQIPPQASQVVARALSKHKQDRYYRVIDFAAELAQALTPEQEAEAEATEIITRLHRPVKAPPRGLRSAARTCSLHPAQKEARTNAVANQASVSVIPDPSLLPEVAGELDARELDNEDTTRTPRSPGPKQKHFEEVILSYLKDADEDKS